MCSTHFLLPELFRTQCTAYSVTTCKARKAEVCKANRKKKSAIKTHIVCTQAPACSTPTLHSFRPHRELNTHFLYFKSSPSFYTKPKASGSNPPSKYTPRRETRLASAMMTKIMFFFKGVIGATTQTTQKNLYHLSPAPSQSSFVYLLIVQNCNHSLFVLST